ncbi:uncharacterized protein [Rutidosis leptorrhynchoides]|uniref:uncharacterized protein n=1 Tax=Rutidosis leptorrhynchoides TaxID=125765 RepID=UPI003A9987BD
MRASKSKETNTFQVVVWCDRHNCGGSNTGRDDNNVSQDLVAHVILEKIFIKPNYELKLIQAGVEEKYGCHIGRKKAWDGKRVALNMVYGTPETNFRELPRYMQALIASNVGTVVQWKLRKVDGIHHRTPKIFRDVQGEGDCCDGQDSKQDLPMAYAIIDEETEHSWSSFFKYLKRYVLGVTVTCIISDRHQRILVAIKKLDMKWPGWGRVPKVKELKSASWALGVEMQQRKYDEAWEVIAEMSSATHNYLRGIALEKWTLYNDGFHRWGIATSNDAESYNNILRSDRFLPIRAFVQATHWKANLIFEDEQNKVHRCATPLAPKQMKVFDTNIIRSRKHKISRHNNRRAIYFVTTHISMPESGSHTHTRLNVDPLTLVHDLYKREGWYRQFSGAFVPVLDQ